MGRGSWLVAPPLPWASIRGNRGARHVLAGPGGASARWRAGPARMATRQQLERTPSELAARLVAIGSALQRYAVRGLALAHSLDVVQHGLHGGVSVFWVLSHGRQDQGIDSLVELVDQPRWRGGDARQLMGQQIVRGGAVERKLARDQAE